MKMVHIEIKTSAGKIHTAFEFDPEMWLELLTDPISVVVFDILSAVNEGYSVHIRPGCFGEGK